MAERKKEGLEEDLALPRSWPRQYRCASCKLVTAKSKLCPECGCHELVLIWEPSDG